MIRTTLATLALGSALVAAAPANAAVTISNTGTTPNAWTVTGPGFVSPAVTVTTLPADWEANSAQGNVSKWVSVNAQGTSTTAPSTVNGNYTYSTSFTGNVGDTLAFLFWADDQVVSYTVDGVTTAVNAGQYQSSTRGSFTVTQPGSSTAARSLAFTVLNNGTPASGNPTGFRFQQMGAVPEPATWAMMVIGFAGVGFGMRRRKSVKTTVQFA